MGAESRKKRDLLSPPCCEVPGCDWPYKIQRHRIIPGREYGRYVVGNVISLCPSHHWMADHEYLSREELFEIVEDRLRKDGVSVTERYHPKPTETSGLLEEAGSSSAKASLPSDGDGAADAINGGKEREF